MSKRFITVVPAIRTVPGVDQFDYAVSSDAEVRVGDLLRVPFRSREIPGLVVSISDSSDHEARAILLDTPEIFLRFGDATASLLTETANRCFSSLPSVLHAWIRAVPKRLKSPSLQNKTSRQLSLAPREARLLSDRLFGKNGLLSEAKKSRGRVLILTPWKQRVEFLAKHLDVDALHADLAMGASWKRVQSFAHSERAILVATRIGAWLSAVADVVLVDEPENDDHKQDELSPRYDARWIVDCASRLRPDLRIVSFGTTPRLGDLPADRQGNEIAPTVEADVNVEGWKKRSGSPIELLSPKTVNDIEAALADGRDVRVLHPVRGFRSRISCHDCGWCARCPACGWSLSLGERHTFCKRCGRRAEIPATCPSCGGTDFSRGMPGSERLAEQCQKYFKSDLIRVTDLASFDDWIIRATNDVRRATPLIAITDLSLLAGAAEDIRRRERLISAWRRVAAGASRLNARLLVQGPEELLAECRSWLTTDGLRTAWKKELEERKTFGFPPAVPLVKILVDGDERAATILLNELGPDASGSYPVPFRTATRKPRWVIHLRPATFDARLTARLETVKGRCFIDLDPIAFFS